MSTYTYKNTGSGNTDPLGNALSMCSLTELLALDKSLMDRELKRKAEKIIRRMENKKLPKQQVKGKP